MAKYTLAQSEQIFNSLEQILQEICDLHQVLFNSLAESQNSHYVTLLNVNEAWAKNMTLFAKIKRLRSMYSPFVKDEE